MKMVANKEFVIRTDQHIIKKDIDKREMNLYRASEKYIGIHKGRKNMECLKQ